jgi:hypothetical protein
MKIRSLSLLIGVVLLVAACGNDASDIVTDTNTPSSRVSVTATSVTEQSEPTQTSEPQATSAVSMPTLTQSAAPTATIEPAATAMPQPTATSTPRATATPQPQEIMVTSHGFGQQEGRREVGWAFILENPNSGLAFERTQYQVAIMDESGTILTTDSGWVNIILPRERTAVSSSSYIPEGTTAASMTVSLNPGRAEALDAQPTFAFERTTYFPGEYFQRVSGILTNPYSRDLSDLRISIVAFDSEDAIIGGGFTYLDFVPASGQTGVITSVTASESPARVEMFASISSLTLLAARGGSADTSALVVVNSGFGQRDGRAEIGWGFVLENPDAEHMIERSRYHVVVYDAGGVVIGVDSGYLTLLLPGQTIGIAGSTYAPDGYLAARTEVQVLSGEPLDARWTNMFSTENVQFMDGQYFPKVTGIVANQTDIVMESIRVSAIAYDDAGQIIGGGFTFVDFVPAQGQAAAEVSVAVAGQPARVELHAVVTSLTKMG